MGAFDVEEEAEGRAGGALTIRTVAGIAEEGGGEEAVAYGGADAAAGYGGEGFMFWFCGFSLRLRLGFG